MLGIAPGYGALFGVARPVAVGGRGAMLALIDVTKNYLEPSVALALRQLPSIQSLIDDQAIQTATTLDGPALTRFLRVEIDRVRNDVLRGKVVAPDEVIARITHALSTLERSRLYPIINATGIIIHTNLGRAPVSDATAAAMAAAAGSTVPLELDPASNERGGRMAEVSDLMRVLTGAEATVVVNNNAAAIFLTLAAMAAGRQVVLSRGEAVEIGGGLRIPDVLRQSGGELVEVGTTNRTYARDYAAAITERTALLLKVHPSNFRITGFTHAASISELASVGDLQGVPVVDDQGSGLLLDTDRYGLPRESTIGDSIAAGASIVTASGDKLLGGPQAGIIAGKATWVERIERHPVARAVRADKTCLAGIAATLRHYTRGEADQMIPVWQMISARTEDLRTRAKAHRDALATVGIEAGLQEARATTGGGSLPGETLPSVALRLQGLDSTDDVEGLARRLRTGRPAFLVA